MSRLRAFTQLTEMNLLVAFVDLTLYTKTCLAMDDAAVAHWMDEFFERLTALVEGGGGIIVKFIGDAALIVFDEPDADRGVQTLLQAKEKVDEWLQASGYLSRLEVKIHFGPVIAGPFGGKNRKQFDVIGKTVNAAATLQSKPFALSVQAFRALAPETRKEFKKHTPPVTYIRLNDRHI